MAYDIIVVGLGPAGSTAAYELSKAGLKVLALEKEKLPRYKSCAGALSLKVERILNLDFKGIVENVVSGIIISYKGKEEFTTRLERPIAYLVRRDRFDYLLTERAKEAGAEVRAGERVLIAREVKDRIEVATEKGIYTANVLIGADGVNSIVSRSLGITPKRKVALTLESEIVVNEAQLKELAGLVKIELAAIPYGYGWLFPKKGYVSVGVAGLPGKVKNTQRYFSKFTEGQEILKGKKIERVNSHFLATLIDDGERVSKERVLLVGDAAGLVDPLIGEGIYYAMRSAQIASRVIVNFIKGEISDLSEYNRIISEEIYWEFKSAYRIARLIYRLPALSYGILEKHRDIAELFLNILRGGERYSNFLKRVKEKLQFRGEYLY